MGEPKKRERWGQPLGGLLNDSYNPKLGWPWHRINQPRVYRQTTEDLVEGLHYEMFEPLASSEPVDPTESLSNVPNDQLFENVPREAGWTLDQIGELLDVTKERVRQIESGALRKLRKHFSQRVWLRTDEAGELIDKHDPGETQKNRQAIEVAIEPPKKDHEYPVDYMGRIIWPDIPVLFEMVHHKNGWEELRPIKNNTPRKGEL